MDLAVLTCLTGLGLSLTGRPWIARLKDLIEHCLITGSVGLYSFVCVGMATSGLCVVYVLHVVLEGVKRWADRAFLR